MQGAHRECYFAELHDAACSENLNGYPARTRVAWKRPTTVTRFTALLPLNNSSPFGFE